MEPFIPDYHNLADCAHNRKPARIPLYEHHIAISHMERLTGNSFGRYLSPEQYDPDRFAAGYCDFYRQAGYDTVSYEAAIVPLLCFGGALSDRGTGYLTDRAKLESYPFDEIEEDFKRTYTPVLDALTRQMPRGMKAVGGCGYGLFEIVQDLVGFQNLCYLQFEDEELYADIFRRCGDFFFRLWSFMTERYADTFCVFRFGDDLGFKLNTMLAPREIRTHLLPQYRRVSDLVHRAGRPFLLHSCGCIFNIMPDLIAAGIDAKHSNEDQIADMSVWVERYGDRIGNFGGIDTDHLVRMPDDELVAEVTRVFRLAEEKNGGFAVGSGNSIPDYVNFDKYMLMLHTVRRLRGEDV